MKEYKTYTTTSDSNIFYYECPVGTKINGVVRETITIFTTDWTCDDGSIEVYPTTVENVAFVSYYGEADCSDGYIAEQKNINIKNLYEFVDEFGDFMSPDDIDSINLRALEI